ncbi:putative membrane protein [Rhodobium orientis]|nr:putative membrane protein [Rhodobium orientis]
MKPKDQKKQRPIEKIGPPESTTRVSGAARLRNYLLTGIIVAGPLGITLYLTWSFIRWVDDWVKPLIPTVYNPEHYLPFAVPGLGLIFSVVGLMLLGFLTANIAGRTIISYGELILGRMPLIRNLYQALKQIFETVLSQRGQSFKKAALVEYPRRGLWAIVFLATDTVGEVADKMPVDDSIISVFLPTTPNPTSGFLLFVPRKDVIPLEMTVEEAAKLVISAGLVSPQYQAKTRELAAGAGVPLDTPEPADAPSNERRPERV